MVAPVGRNGLEALLSVVASEDDTRLRVVVRASIAALALQLRALKAQILEFDGKILQWHRSNELSKRFDESPGLRRLYAVAMPVEQADAEGAL
jgi:transposase